MADTLAQILIELDELEEAKAVYDGVISDKTRNDEVYLNYIELLLKMDLKPSWAGSTRVKQQQSRLDSKIFIVCSFWG